MKVNLGWKTLDDNDATWIYGFKSLIDHDPASSDVRDAVGDHYDVLKSKDGDYLIRYRIRGQESFGAPAFTAAEGLIPIPIDIALLLVDRDTSKANIEGKSEPKQFEAIIGEIEDWISAVEPAIRDSAELAEDVINDLKEMLKCLNVQAYRGCLAMAGVILERTIKQVLSDNHIEYAKDWMVGKLIGELSKSDAYVDPSLKNIWNIINAQRIIGVHATEAIPIPSRDQALMVVFAIKDIVARTYKANKRMESNG